MNKKELSASIQNFTFQGGICFNFQKIGENLPFVDLVVT